MAQLTIDATAERGRLPACGIPAERIVMLTGDRMTPQ